MTDGVMTCAFTGHRRINPLHKGRIEDYIARAVKYAYERGVRCFSNGGALGFDTLSARQVILFRMSHPDVRLRMYLPCYDQDSSWSDRDKDMYSFLLRSADSVEYVSDSYFRGCMQKRNRRLIETADMLIAYVGQDSGGSVQTLSLARARGIEIYNLYPHI